MRDDTELQSTVARVLAREPEPGGIGDLHADVAVLRSRLREAVEALRPFGESVKDHDSSNTVHGVPIDDETKLADYEAVWGKWLTIGHARRAAAFIAELEREAGK